MLSVTFGTYHDYLLQAMPIYAVSRSHTSHIYYRTCWYGQFPQQLQEVEAGHELKASMLQVVGITASLIRIKKKKEEASTTNDYFTTVIVE